MIRTQFAEILEIFLKSFPQGVQIHVIFKKRVKPAHRNERLLRPFRLLELRRIASSKNGQGQYCEYDQDLVFAGPLHGWLLYLENYLSKYRIRNPKPLRETFPDQGFWTSSYLW